MKKKVVFFSGGRSDFSLLKNTILQFQKSKKFKTTLILGPSHFNKDIGNTFLEVSKSKIKNIIKIKTKKISTDNIGISKIISDIILQSSKIFKNKNFDLAFILGDRYEAIAFSLVCSLNKIPIAHLHGGETTLGAYDNQFRNGITKIASLHFTSTEKHKQNVLKMCEKKKLVFNVGAPSVENIKLLKFKSKNQIFKEYKIPNNKKVVILTMHPETMSDKSILQQLSSIYKVFKNEKFYLVVTSSNLDTGGLEMNKAIKKFFSKMKNFKFIESFGQNDYLNLMKYCEFVCGNSSSGIIEAPSLKVKTLNIGDRQKGRELSNQTLSVNNEYSEIKKGIKKLDNMKLKKIINPYDGGETSKNIFKIVDNLKNKNLLKIKYE